MVVITDEARDKIKEALEQNQGKSLRIYMDGVGWSGPRLGLALDEPAAEEKATEINGIDVLLDDRIKPFVQDITLDYVKNNGEEGFMLTTGKEDSCSCSGKDDNCSCCWGREKPKKACL